MSFLKSGAQRLALAAGGVVLTLAWWTFTGSDSGSGIPTEDLQGELLDSVHGGGMTITVELEVSHPVYFSEHFACPVGDTGGHKEWSATKNFDPGRHEVSVEVGPECWAGLFELGLQDRDAEIGTSLWWKVKVDGDMWEREEAVLEQPLGPRRALFLQTGWDDLSLAEVHQYRRGR